MLNEPYQNPTVTLTVLFDNVAGHSELQTGWGFACLIQTDNDTLLFDTGSRGAILLNNMTKLKLDLRSIQSVVISHPHWDHVGGLTDFLKTNPHVKVYLPNSSAAEFEDQIKASGAEAIRITALHRIGAGIFSLGELAAEMPEQSLAICTVRGLVIVTGCAHPGIVNILKQARLLFPDDAIYLALGGFHLKNTSAAEVAQIALAMQQLGVRKIAPSHCTGEEAIEIFREKFGQNFIQSGVGEKIIVGKTN